MVILRPFVDQSSSGIEDSYKFSFLFYVSFIATLWAIEINPSYRGMASETMVLVLKLLLHQVVDVLNSRLILTFPLLVSNSPTEFKRSRGNSVFLPEQFSMMSI